MDFNVIVVGAGAAGMMCAAVAGQRGRRVLLVEHSTKLGEKIRISGGGRCNFTNVHTKPEAFLSRNAAFCRSALARYTPRDFITLVERHAITYHEKTLGQLFCNESATQIIAMLKHECDAANVHWAIPAAVERVKQIVRSDPDGGTHFEVVTSQGSFRARSVVIATGGLSIPKIGASPFGYRIAEQFGVPIVAPKPALVPLAAAPEWLAQFGDLSGTSFDTIASCTGRPVGEHFPAFRESALVTHRGLSGPAILQVSSYWQLGSGGAVTLDLMPERDAGAWLAAHRSENRSPGALLEEFLPRRFAQSFAKAHGWTQPLAQLSNATLEVIAQTLKAWRIHPSGTLGYSKAEVTLGGVDTDALSQKTMESRAVPGLYFIGEVVDVTGWLGGYNFQWAWSSGHAAGLAL
jgi:predicted Rossmann fold flavoprotein